MDNWEYKVNYLNGKHQYFYCNNFIEAIVLAMAYAHQNNWEMGIKQITDETGATITDIEYPTFKFSK